MEGRICCNGMLFLGGFCRDQPAFLNRRSGASILVAVSHAHGLPPACVSESALLRVSGRAGGRGGRRGGRGKFKRASAHPLSVQAATASDSAQSSRFRLARCLAAVVGLPFCLSVCLSACWVSDVVLATGGAAYPVFEKVRMTGRPFSSLWHRLSGSALSLSSQRTPGP